MRQASDMKKRLRKKLGPFRDIIKQYRTKRRRRLIIAWSLGPPPTRFQKWLLGEDDALAPK